MSRPSTSFTRTLRALHTSRAASEPRPVGRSTSSFRSLIEAVVDGPPRKTAVNRGAALRDGFSGGSGSGGGSGGDNVRRGGELLDGFARSAQGDGGVRARAFDKGHVTAPHNYLPTSLFPNLAPQKRYAKPPLLGPPASQARQIDPFHILETSPLKYDLNPKVVRSFVNDMGKIKSRAETGLTWRSQRMAGKVVRRARSMGLIGRWSNRPPVGGLGWSEEWR